MGRPARPPVPSILSITEASSFLACSRSRDLFRPASSAVTPSVVMANISPSLPPTLLPALPNLISISISLSRWKQSPFSFTFTNSLFVYSFSFFSTLGDEILQKGESGQRSWSRSGRNCAPIRSFRARKGGKKGHGCAPRNSGMMRAQGGVKRRNEESVEGIDWEPGGAKLRWRRLRLKFLCTTRKKSDKNRLSQLEKKKLISCKMDIHSILRNCNWIYMRRKRKEEEGQALCARA